MVALRQPRGPERIVVKRARASVMLSRQPVCLWPGCGAALAGDHDKPVCGCHVRSSYRLPHDKRAAALVLHLLLAAYPGAVDLCAVLHATSHELEPILKRLRRRGHLIRGARRGYVYGIEEDGDRVDRRRL